MYHLTTVHSRSAEIHIYFSQINLHIHHPLYIKTLQYGATSAEETRPSWPSPLSLPVPRRREHSNPILHLFRKQYNKTKHHNIPKNCCPENPKTAVFCKFYVDHPKEQTNSNNSPRILPPYKGFFTQKKYPFLLQEKNFHLAETANSSSFSFHRKTHLFCINKLFITNSTPLFL